MLFTYPKIVSAEFFTIKKYNVDITIKKDAVIEIKEEILVNFTEQRHGIFRKIPYKYEIKRAGEDSAERPLTLMGSYKYDIFDVDVPGEKTKIYKEGNYIVIRIGDAKKYVFGEKMYTIRYKVYGGINFFKHHAEFYWNIIGTEWDVPIERVESYIFLPSDIELSKDGLFVYTGKYGSTEQKVSYSFDGKTVIINTTAPLMPREGVSVGIKFKEGYLTKGSVFLNLWLFTINNWIFFIPFLVFIVFFILWRFYGKDEKVVKMIHYKPPQNTTPAEAGVVIDDNLNARDLISLIFYWAANGYIEIEEVEDPSSLIFKKRDYILTKLKDLPEDAKSYEKVFFSGLFPMNGVNSCRISTLKDQFYETMATAREYLYQEIESKKLYTYPIQYGLIYYGLAIITVVVAVLLGIVLKRMDYFLSLMISAVIIFFFAGKMPKKSEEGLKLYGLLEGFKDFILRVEKPRLVMLLKEDPTYFDKTLPYAIAFGIVDKWAEKFEGLLKEPPNWYKGYSYSNRFSTISFVDSLNLSVSNMNTIFTSNPSQAGGGGTGFSSGGGFSGGGGGGGGGGSW